VAGWGRLASLRYSKQEFFFEKKNQKTFAPFGTRGGNASAPIDKSFLLLFFKKEVLSS
jgi:hypothetical protein